jgi:hypothetical protein
VITEERILGKLFHQAGRRSSDAAETLLVAKTWAPLLGNPQGNALCGEGEVIADG